MPLPVQHPDFWRERIDRATREGKEHYAVYLARQTLWDTIAAAHQRILRLECAGYKTLDAGCGYGRASEWVDDYTGVDISPDFIARAQQRYPSKQFLVGDLRKLPFPDGHFDVAFCISIKQMVLGNCELSEWDAMERELQRVAKKVLLLEYEDPETYTIV